MAWRGGAEFSPFEKVGRFYILRKYRCFSLLRFDCSLAVESRMLRLVIIVLWYEDLGAWDYTSFMFAFFSRARDLSFRNTNEHETSFHTLAKPQKTFLGGSLSDCALQKFLIRNSRAQRQRVISARRLNQSSFQLSHD